MAAAALVIAGFDVLLADTSAVFVRDPRPYFAAQRCQMAVKKKFGGDN